MGCFQLFRRPPSANERFYAAMYGYAFVIRRHVLGVYNEGLEESRALTANGFDRELRVDHARMRGAFEGLGVPYRTYWFLRFALCNGKTTYEAVDLKKVRANEVLSDLDAVYGVPMCIKRAFVEVVSCTTGERTAPALYYAGAA